MSLYQPADPLFHSFNIRDLNYTQIVVDVVSVKFNMFGHTMLNQIVGNLNNHFVVTTSIFLDRTQVHPREF